MRIRSQSFRSSDREQTEIEVYRLYDFCSFIVVKITLFWFLRQWDDLYKILQKKKNVHWYCVQWVGCERGAAMIVEALAKVHVRMDGMESQLKELSERVLEERRQR